MNLLYRRGADGAIAERRAFLRGVAASALVLAAPRLAYAETSIGGPFPSTDLESGRYGLTTNINYATPAPRSAYAGYGVEESAMRLSDDGALDGKWNTVYCSDGTAGNSAVISLYRTAAGRVSDTSLVENLRFGYARYGIMTPWAADRPSVNPPPVLSWYNRGGHIVRKIYGQAYGIGIRIAGRETLIEDFVLDGVGGATGAASRTFGILLLGPNPTVRNGIIRRIVHGQPVSGQEPESVGLGFSADCHGGTVENVSVANPAQLTGNSIALWFGYSHGVTVKNFRAKNFKYAIDYNDTTMLVEDSHSFDCEYGFGRVANDPRVKFRNVWDHKVVNGVMQSVDVSNI